MKHCRYLIFFLAYFISFFSSANTNNPWLAVVLYADEDQQGDSYPIQTEAADLGFLDKQMSSFDLQPGFTIRFYEGKNFTGGYYSVTSKTNHDNLMKLIDNKISSVRVLAYPETVPLAAKLYSGANFTGEELELRGDYFDLPSSFNGKVGSFKIQPGFSLRFFSESNYSGGFYTRLPNANDEENPSWGSVKISSAKIVVYPSLEDLANNDSSGGSDDYDSSDSSSTVSTYEEILELDDTYATNFPSTENRIQVNRMSTGDIMITSREKFIALTYEENNPQTLEIFSSYPILPTQWRKGETQYNVKPCYQVRFYSNPNYRGSYWDVPSKDIPAFGMLSDITSQTIQSMQLIATRINDTKYIPGVVDIAEKDEENDCWLGHIREYD